MNKLVGLRRKSEEDALSKSARLLSEPEIWKDYGTSYIPLQQPTKFGAGHNFDELRVGTSLVDSTVRQPPIFRTLPTNSRVIYRDPPNIGFIAQPSDLRPYTPGAMSRRYNKLLPDARARVNLAVDAEYKAQTGLTIRGENYPLLDLFVEDQGLVRKLDWNNKSDRPRARRWLHIRDLVMQNLEGIIDINEEAESGEENPEAPSTIRGQIKKKLEETGITVTDEVLDWIERISKIAHVVEALELVGFLHKLGAAGAVAGTVGSVANIVLTPIFVGIEIWKSWTMPIRHYGMQGAKYATVAWAFGQTPPTECKGLWERKRLARDYVTEEDRSRYDEAWGEAADTTVAKIQERVSELAVRKELYQAALRVIGNNNPNGLCVEIHEKIKERLGTGIDKMSWDNYAGFIYPN